MSKELKVRSTEYVGFKDPIGEGLYNMGLTDERIVRCRDCKYEFEEWGYPYCCRNAPHSVIEVDGDGFCKWGEPRSE